MGASTFPVVFFAKYLTSVTAVIVVIGLLNPEDWEGASFLGVINVHDLGSVILMGYSGFCMFSDLEFTGFCFVLLKFSFIYP